MYHYRKTYRKYKSHPKTSDCGFCDIEAMRPNIIEETDYYYIVPNRTFYDAWEMRTVEDHLLVIPKQHTETLHTLEDSAQLAIIKAISKYEAQSYNVYARAPGNTHKSVPHHHTHLIKISSKQSHGALYMRKPYIFFKF